MSSGIFFLTNYEENITRQCGSKWHACDGDGVGWFFRLDDKERPLSEDATELGLWVQSKKVTKQCRVSMGRAGREQAIEDPVAETAVWVLS